MMETAAAKDLNTFCSCNVKYLNAFLLHFPLLVHLDVPCFLISVENVVFCEITPLQLKLYGHVLQSSTLKSCLSCSSDSLQHLVCIGILKKLCNSPNLLYPAVNASVDNDTSVSMSDLNPSMCTVRSV